MQTFYFLIDCHNISRAINEFGFDFENIEMHRKEIERAS